MERGFRHSRRNVLGVSKQSNAIQFYEEDVIV
jgi:hypothetical protein